MLGGGYSQQNWCVVYDDLTLTERQNLGINEQVFQGNKLNNISNSLGVKFITPIDYQLTQLNLNTNSINLNTSQFTSGLYRVVLVCDNNVIESHNLIIQ